MARITDSVNMALSKIGKKMKYLDENWVKDHPSRNVIYNKSMRDSWSSKDLVKAAKLMGCKLAFIFPDGQQIFIDTDTEDGD